MLGDGLKNANAQRKSASASKTSASFRQEIVSMWLKQNRGMLINRAVIQLKGNHQTAESSGYC